jgi:hypothetical protein
VQWLKIRNTRSYRGLNRWRRLTLVQRMAPGADKLPEEKIHRMAFSKPRPTRLSRWDVLAASLLRSRPSLARSGARYPHPGEAF